MSLETESILDRRRLRRKLGVWRSLAVVAVIIALAVTAVLTGKTKDLIGQEQIARVTISGVISEDRRQLNMLKRIADDKNVKGVLLFVNSPGGTTTGAEALFNGIRAVSANKPVVAQFGTVAASAAYIAGLATDHIVARENTITGSVGVIMQWPEVTGLLEKIGVKMNEIKSGPLKATPSPFQPVSPEARRITEEMISEGQKWFVGLVEKRRKVNVNTIPGLTEGRVYLGRNALRHKLIDAIGGEDEAIEWMVKQRNVASGLKIVDWKPDDQLQWPLSGAIAGFFSDVITRTAANVGRSAAASRELGRLGLDGLISVWHPGKN